MKTFGWNQKVQRLFRFSTQNTPPAPTLSPPKSQLQAAKTDGTWIKFKVCLSFFWSGSCPQHMDFVLQDFRGSEEQPSTSGCSLQGERGMLRPDQGPWGTDRLGLILKGKWLVQGEIISNLQVRDLQPEECQPFRGKALSGSGSKPSCLSALQKWVVALKFSKDILNSVQKHAADSGSHNKLGLHWTFYFLRQISQNSVGEEIFSVWRCFSTSYNCNFMSNMKAFNLKVLSYRNV